VHPHLLLSPIPPQTLSQNTLLPLPLSFFVCNNIFFFSIKLQLRAPLSFVVFVAPPRRLSTLRARSASSSLSLLDASFAVDLLPPSRQTSVEGNATYIYFPFLFFNFPLTFPPLCFWFTDGRPPKRYKGRPPLLSFGVVIRRHPGSTRNGALCSHPVAAVSFCRHFVSSCRLPSFRIFPFFSSQQAFLGQ